MSSTIINSELREISASAQEVFDYLADFNNIRELLPEDKISEWDSDTNQCSFKVANAAIIPLIKDSVSSPEQINIVSGEKSPFPFTLVMYINPKENYCEGYMVFEGEINAFLKMMVVTPLSNLFNYMGEELQKKFQQ
jgi:hypothetical protein